MTAEEFVYFPRSGDEPSKFVLVRLFEKNGERLAELSVAGPAEDSADYDDAPATGDPQTVLRDARERAGLSGLDLRVQLDGVEWDPELGSLVEPK